MKFEFYCIVEGYGEVQAVRVLLRRIQVLIRPDIELIVHRPHRASRAKLLKENELERALRLANLKLSGPGAILILLDAADDPPCELGPRLLARAGAVYRTPGVEVSVVLAKCEFEAWFLAGYESIAGRRGLAGTLSEGISPEAVRDAKGVLGNHMRGKYAETMDQPAFAALFDLSLARQRSPSFDKLWRDVERLLTTQS
jgi:hypothetical protein